MVNEVNHQEDIEDLDLNEFLTEKGYYSIPPKACKSLSNDEKEKIKQLNGLLRKKRKNFNEGEHINTSWAVHPGHAATKMKTVQF